MTKKTGTGAVLDFIVATMGEIAFGGFVSIIKSAHSRVVADPRHDYSASSSSVGVAVLKHTDMPSFMT